VVEVVAEGAVVDDERGLEAAVSRTLTGSP
jgi:hypothetical protein